MASGGGRLPTDLVFRPAGGGGCFHANGDVDTACCQSMIALQVTFAPQKRLASVVKVCHRLSFVTPVVSLYSHNSSGDRKSYETPS